jgi:hypothetical protein
MSEHDANRQLNDTARLRWLDLHDPLEDTQRLPIYRRRELAHEAARLHILNLDYAVIEQRAYATDVGDFRDGQRSEYSMRFQDLRVGGDE